MKTKYILVGDVVSYSGRNECGEVCEGVGKYVGNVFSTIALGDVMVFESLNGDPKIRRMEARECFDKDGNILCDDGYLDILNAVKRYNDRRPSKDKKCKLILSWEE